MFNFRGKKKNKKRLDSYWDEVLLIRALTDKLENKADDMEAKAEEMQFEINKSYEIIFALLDYLGCRIDWKKELKKKKVLELDDEIITEMVEKKKAVVKKEGRKNRKKGKKKRKKK